MADSFAMWGPQQSGPRIVEQDSLAQFAHQAQAAHQVALAQQEALKTKQLRQQMQAMSQLTSDDGQNGPGAGGTMGDYLMAKAKKAFDLGLPDEGLKLSNAAANIASKEVMDETRKTQALDREAEVRRKAIDDTLKIYQGVNSKEDWARANLLVSQMFPGQHNPLAGLPYDPAYVSLAKTSLLSQKDKLEIGIRQAREASLERKDRAQEGFLGFREKIMNAQEKDRERRTDIYEKNGGSKGQGTPVGFPTKQESAAAEGILKKQVPGLPDDELQAAGIQIASEAKAMVKANKGLDWNTALERATAKSVKENDFTTISKSGMFGSTSKPHFEGGGKTPDTALPATKDTQFKKGRFYQTPKGVLQWTGTGFVQAAGGAPSAGPTTPPPAEPPPEDDEEE